MRQVKPVSFSAAPATWQKPQGVTGAVRTRMQCRGLKENVQPLMPAIENIALIRLQPLGHVIPNQEGMELSSIHRGACCWSRSHSQTSSVSCPLAAESMLSPCTGMLTLSNLPPPFQRILLQLHAHNLHHFCVAFCPNTYACTFFALCRQKGKRGNIQPPSPAAWRQIDRSSCHGRLIALQRSGG